MSGGSGRAFMTPSSPRLTQTTVTVPVAIFSSPFVSVHT